MRRWEKLNKQFDTNECLEEQALGMIIATALEDMGAGTYRGMEEYYSKFKGMKEWLNEKVEETKGDIDNE